MIRQGIITGLVIIASVSGQPRCRQKAQDAPESPLIESRTLVSVFTIPWTSCFCQLEPVSAKIFVDICKFKFASRLQDQLNSCMGTYVDEVLQQQFGALITFVKQAETAQVWQPFCSTKECSQP